MNEISVTQAWTQMLTLAAGVVTLSKLWDIIRERLKPGRQLKEDVAKNTLLIKNDTRRLDEMEAAQKEQQKVNAVIFRALFAQINHVLSGNGNDILKKSRDELQNYLSGRN